MTAIADRVLATVQAHRMIPAGGRVLVALSGGPDSVALTLVLLELEREGAVRVAGLGHLNHALRDDAARDEEFCRALATRIEKPFRSARADVRAVAREQHRSIEDAARRARYAFLEDARAELGADLIATGHTLDDQAETFLLRLIRGAGPEGLAGIFPVAGRIVRPLLDVRRQELLQYLSAAGQHFCDDPTNRELSIPRNRIRHELLPLLRRDYSAGIDLVLAREAAIARADHEHLRQQAIESASLIVLRSSGGTTEPLTPGWLAAFDADGRRPPLQDPASKVVSIELDADRLAALPRAVGSRLARLALEILAPDRFVGHEHIEALLRLASAGSGRASVSLPGQQASRRGARVVLEGERAGPFENPFAVPLSIPGEVLLATQGWAISAQSDSEGPQPGSGHPRDPLTVAIRKTAVAGPLQVRSRKPGDWLRPTGLGGRRKKLQDLLVDRKVPREARDSLPLVVDADGRIVWVVGLVVAEDFRVTEPSQGVIFLKARRLGGPG